MNELLLQSKTYSEDTENPLSIAKIQELER